MPRSSRRLTTSFVVLLLPIAECFISAASLRGLHHRTSTSSDRRAEDVVGAPRRRRTPCAPTMHSRGDSTDRGLNRREVFAAAALAGAVTFPPRANAATGRKYENAANSVNLVKVTDPSTYSALMYAPPSSGKAGKLPLIIVLHGAGKNELDAWSLADPTGEHAGLAPSLLATGRAPPELANNFALAAPYSAGKRSFYEEPRKRMLQFVDWVCSDSGRAAGCPDVDPNRVFLFGFSDGATVGIELMTTGRFKGGVFAAYGFTGVLPDLALQRLKNMPIWMFHSADDVIFPVSCSDRLVASLRKVQV